MTHILWKHHLPGPFLLLLFLPYPLLSQRPNRLLKHNRPLPTRHTRIVPPPPILQSNLPNQYPHKNNRDQLRNKRGRTNLLGNTQPPSSGAEHRLIPHFTNIMSPKTERTLPHRRMSYTGCARPLTRSAFRCVWRGSAVCVQPFEHLLFPCPAGPIGFCSREEFEVRFRGRGRGRAGGRRGGGGGGHGDRTG